jgi:hypothetical protein
MEKIGKGKVTASGTVPRDVRLIIGKHEMNPFSGLSYGDRFETLDGKVWHVRINSYGISLKPEGEILGESLEGFSNLPDYQAFVWAINNALNQ